MQGSKILLRMVHAKSGCLTEAHNMVQLSPSASMFAAQNGQVVASYVQSSLDRAN
jgi:hypothetical protein